MSESKYPVFFEGNPLILSSKEKDFLDHFVNCGDFDDACKKSGMTEAKAKLFLDSNRIKAYITEKISQISRRNDITLESVLDRLHKIAWGELKVTRFEMKALEILAGYLNIVKPHTQVNIGIKADNPLKDVSDQELEGMMRARVSNGHIEVEGEHHAQG